MKTYPFMVMDMERRGGQREGKKYLHKGNFMPAFRQIMGGLRALSASVDYPLPYLKRDFPGGSDVKNLPAMRETQVQSLGGEDPLEKRMEPTPIFFLGESHGQRNLVSCTPWGHKELDMTE